MHVGEQLTTKFGITFTTECLLFRALCGMFCLKFVVIIPWHIKIKDSSTYLGFSSMFDA